MTYLHTSKLYLIVKNPVSVPVPLDSIESPVYTVETMNFQKKVFGQLVMLGFDIAVFTPASYQRHRL